MSLRSTHRLLFSAYAEVFLKLNHPFQTWRAFLCLRRGVSVAVAPDPPETVFSLPTQRCFPESASDWAEGILFSAYAEVFLSIFPHTSAPSSFLCLRRGVSSTENLKNTKSRFSLPTQRCFQLS